jgi:hypothetical protein
MLKLISLYTINKIFSVDSLINNLNPKCKIAYIQCLTYHFEDLEPKIVNLQSFDIPKKVINIKSMELFKQLEQAGLVIINDNSLTFVNHWHKYIDKSQLEKVKPHEYLGLMDYKLANNFKNDIINSGSFCELILMEYKIDRDKVVYLINRFFNEQNTHEQSYPNYQAASRHCLSWIKKELKNNQGGVITKTINARNNAHNIINEKYGE